MFTEFVVVLSISYLLMVGLSYIGKKCPFDEIKCLNRRSCQCGKSGKKKAAKRQEDIVRQERASADQRASQVQSQQQALADQLQQRYISSVAPTGLETERLNRLRTLEPDVERMLRGIALGGERPVQTPLGTSIEERLMSDLATPRQIPYEETFNPAFDLLRQQVRAQAAQRGLVGSGLELENLGRAGIDLAIKQAQERQNNRLINENLRQQAFSNAITGQGQLESIGAQKRSELENSLRGYQSLEDARRAREIAGQQQGAFGSAELAQTGNLQALGQRSQAAQNAFNLESPEVQFMRQQSAERQAGLGRLAGTVAGAAAGIPFGPSGIMTGAQMGGNIFGGGGGGGDTNSLLSMLSGDRSTGFGIARPNYQGISDYIESSATPGSRFNLNQAQQPYFGSAERAAMRINRNRFNNPYSFLTYGS